MSAVYVSPTICFFTASLDLSQTPCSLHLTEELAGLTATRARFTSQRSWLVSQTPMLASPHRGAGWSHSHPCSLHLTEELAGLTAIRARFTSQRSWLVSQPPVLASPHRGADWSHRRPCSLHLTEELPGLTDARFTSQRS